MKTFITILLIVQAQGKPPIFTTPADRDFLDKFGCHITKNTKNNDLADEAISLLNWRDKNKVKSDTIHIAKK